MEELKGNRQRKRVKVMIDTVGHMGAFGVWGMLLALLFWLGLIALIVWGASALFPGRGASDKEVTESAIEILKRRYASGEITQGEFELARKAIG